LLWLPLIAHNGLQSPHHIFQRMIHSPNMAAVPLKPSTPSNDILHLSHKQNLSKRAPILSETTEEQRSQQFKMCRELLESCADCLQSYSRFRLCTVVRKAASETWREACERCTKKSGKRSTRKGQCSACRGVNGLSVDYWGITFDEGDLSEEEKEKRGKSFRADYSICK
jgi:hypothetical protein